MMKKTALILFALVIASGCIQGTGGDEAQIDANNGIVINEFSADPSVVVAGEDLSSIYLEVENMGGTTATGVTVSIEGSGFTGVGEKTIGTMSPPDLETDTPGDFAARQWELNPVNVGEGIKHTYTISGRVTYGYTTTAAATVPLYSHDEFRRLQKLGQEIKDKVTLTNTAAPIKVGVSGAVPLIARDSEDEGTYRFEFINVGDGMPATAGEDGLIEGTISVTGPVEFSSCLGQSGQTITLGDETAPMEEQVKIRQGETAKRACTVAMTEDPAPKEDITFTFELDYDYYVTEEVGVTVIGVRETD